MRLAGTRRRFARTDVRRYATRKRPQRHNNPQETGRISEAGYALGRRRLVSRRRDAGRNARLAPQRQTIRTPPLRETRLK